ncbi:cytochrome c [Paracoccus versutus]|uniref:Cbb3-type cytochrome c oxidase subunit III n=1 Tax=Paracoccus versutus TaxID=34007 RepID=A0AAQ0HCB3_PARVE|nr:cytochrome c [Paracoccus versutus]KGJ07666.1 hypothetical protein IT40_20170 [Paracoccus versutus]REG27435.1 cbb3-type cytochrome c oxidase subunit III [Paracoccus versutus]WEJ77612.1 cytochrome c [Paracoccus versutus]
MFDPRLTPALALVLAAGGTALADTPRLDAQRMFPSGEIAFQKICARCHTGREDAVGPDLTANDYDADTIRHFARHGSGPMPTFTESMVDAASLDEIAAHLAATRKEAQE